MNTTTAIWAEVDQAGRLVLPSEVASRLGLQPGAQVRLEEGANDLRIHRSVTQLAKVYIEPTNRCNLACRTCMRNSWDVKMGQMREAIFSRIIAGLRAISPTPSVFFGGLGEPLAHPRTIEMIARVKALGSTTEIITNGTLLDETRARADRSWPRRALGLDRRRNAGELR